MSAGLLRSASALAVVVVALAAPVSAAGGTTGQQAAESGPKPNQIVTVAGTGEASFSGDGGPARDARLSNSLGIAVGPDGTVYIADHFNHRLRAVDDRGVITTITGVRSARPSAEDLFFPRHTVRAVAVGDDGAVYVANGSTIERFDPDGDVEVVAGDDGETFMPSDIAVDADGNVYVAEPHRNGLRRIATDGTVTTVAGGGPAPLEQAVGGAATDAAAESIASVAVDSKGAVYFSQRTGGSPVVWKVDTDGKLAVAAGSGEPGYSGDGGPAAEARLSSAPGGLAVDDDDNLYLTDVETGQVRLVDDGGVITTAGPGFYQGDDTFGPLADLAVGRSGDVYVTGGAQVRMLVRDVEGPAPAREGGSAGADAGPDPWAEEAPGTVITVAGNGETPRENLDQQIRLEPPTIDSVAVAEDGALLYADSFAHRVLRVDADGTIDVVAGSGLPGFSGDGGPAVEAELARPVGIALDADGTLYIADNGNGRVRAVDPDGVITTVAGTGASLEDAPAEGALGDGGPATEAVLRPTDVAVGADGRLLVVDEVEGVERGARLRVVERDGTIGTLAGGGDREATDELGEPAVDGARATDVRLNGFDLAVAAGADGTVHLTDGRPSLVDEGEVAPIYTVDREGIVTVTARGGPGSPTPDPATQLSSSLLRDLTLGPDGALYVADAEGNVVRRIDTDGAITTFAGTGANHDDGDGGPATEAAIRAPGSVAFDGDGNLYIGSESGRIRRVDTGGVITTVLDPADGAAAGAQGRAVEAPLDGAAGVAVDPRGVLHVVESGTGLVRRVDRDGSISTVMVDEHGEGAEPLRVRDARTVVPAPGTDGSLHVGHIGSVKRVYPDGAMVTIAGGGSSAEPPEEARVATTAQLSLDRLAVAPDGTLYIADSQRETVYRLERDGRLSALVGYDTISEQLISVEGMAADGDGNLYVSADRAVHRVAPDGTVSRFAGKQDPTFRDGLADGGPASEAAVFWPRALAAGPDGSVYIGSAGSAMNPVNDVIRRVDPDGTIATVFDEDAEAAEVGSVDAMFDGISGLAVDAHGNLYFSDSRHNLVRVVVRPGETVTVDGSSGVGALGVYGAAVVVLVGVVVAGLWWRRRRGTPDPTPPAEEPGPHGTRRDAEVDTQPAP